ncbi:MAG: BlaI/MecI/CopY family transcriptional regulator [Candidatus Methylacidiphilales bacterium]|nr:BlaI/MecI/CopY family transcriptional regulator [Candidatus Methylacidiphilales bacterium]
MNKKTPHPTEAELEILQVLWAAGEPLTVRQVWEKLGQKGAYTTVLKMLQIMLEKGSVTRDATLHSHLYAAAFAERENQERMVGGLMERVFGGSLSQLVLRALSAKAASAQELEAVQEMLRKARSEQRPQSGDQSGQNQSRMKEACEGDGNLD